MANPKMVKCWDCDGAECQTCSHTGYLTLDADAFVIPAEDIVKCQYCGNDYGKYCCPEEDPEETLYRQRELWCEEQDDNARRYAESGRYH